MGATDSNCCSSCGPNKHNQNKKELQQTTSPKELQKQRSKQGRGFRDTEPMVHKIINSGDTSKRSGEPGSGGDVKRAMKNVIEVIKHYNKWLRSNILPEEKKNNSNAQRSKLEAYRQSVQTIIKVVYNSTNQFVADVALIKNAYHYKHDSLRQSVANHFPPQQALCEDDNCWSMRHFFGRNIKDASQLSSDPLEILTNIHVFVFHSLYISEFQIQDIHPRVVYVTATYFERKIRTKNIEIYQRNDTKSDVFPVAAVQICALYLGAKYVEEDDSLDAISPVGMLTLAQKIGPAMLDQVYDKVDEDGSKSIDAGEVHHILMFLGACLATNRLKVKNAQRAQKIDKAALNQVVAPISEWMKKTKFVGDVAITKDQFKETMSAWLKEYHDTNGGIIADAQEQQKMLERYKVSDSRQPMALIKAEYERLVINCEYLEEQVAVQDMHEVDSDGDDDEVDGDELQMTNGARSKKKRRKKSRKTLP
mmetsp:Transcript_46985/g.77997  ORF Transcript_46985/g.77997 Transcript_46985/m.77997 type:complete len:478 (+) Transcript_46985:39-1472(+)